ncbi:hypothetical protein BN946_scf185008.g128 [Trametes cinnabarina]|uniref:Mannose-6-phosphate isomerase n=1 Tax=Pycnoporus cinnabarinus TaxID=5643 RepID=A0A060SG76_PYCCI|nr:hypothetical protein BN946_scf185008.g128 [Trametes cinnabarina]
MAAVFKIIPTIQQYDWGKIGLSSKVAQYAVACRLPDFTLDESVPYAELWMGTHHSSPSRLLDGTKLSDHLAAHPELMGPHVIDRFKDAGAAEGNLPFLFKVLAIEKALSIQTHPDKPMAERLHKERPDVYKDANHKPEMALALTPFQAMCGFLPLQDIAAFINSTPEFAALVPPTITQRFLSVASASASSDHPQVKAALKDVFSAVMTASMDLFRPALGKLVARYEAGDVRDVERGVRDLVLSIAIVTDGRGVISWGAAAGRAQGDAQGGRLEVSEGEVFFVGAGQPLEIVAQGEGELDIHRAFVEAQ